MTMLNTEGQFINGSELRNRIRAEYDRVARDPYGSRDYYSGAAYAHKFLKYDAHALRLIPEASAARFSGVGNPLRIADTYRGAVPLQPGDTVLDHACGAGMDLLLAARKIGPAGRAIGVDMTRSMREHAENGARQSGFSATVDIRDGLCERLPVDDESVDVVISNGVIHLSPDRHGTFSEIFRVLKPGGQLLLADIFVRPGMSEPMPVSPGVATTIVGSSLTESELSRLAAISGLTEGRILEHFDCQPKASAEQPDLSAHVLCGANFYARKPGPGTPTRVSA